MPTVLVVDVSLSMARHSLKRGVKENSPGIPSTVEDMTDLSYSDSAITKKALAVRSVYKFLDSLGHHAKLEYVSLVIFSSLWEIAVPFTRDYDSIKSAADNIQLYDKTCLESAFTAPLEVIQNMWGNNMSCQVLVITDGLTEITSDTHEKITTTTNYPFPCDFHMICLSAVEEFCCSENISGLKQLMADIGGDVSIPETTADFQSIENLVEMYVKKTYKVFSGVLICGTLTNNIQLYPPPTSAIREDDFTYEEMEFPHSIHIVGFVAQTDIKSPACVSRHLVLPLKANTTDVETTEDGKTPSFTVLLHGALKVECHVAIVRISDDWYGMLHSWADSRKKSNLVLSVYKPGIDSVPWLGDIRLLSSLPALQGYDIPGVVNQQTSGLPVPITEKKSYANSAPSWLRQATLQSDVQKLLRYGRKLPDKLNIFYKELNRIHKAAVSIGFYQLLIGLSQILERECTLLPPNAHPDAAMQLQHAASLLSKKEVTNMNYIIRPLSTNFQSDQQPA